MTHARVVKKAVFPVAGFGTRFLPATKAIVGARTLLFTQMPKAILGRAGTNKRVLLFKMGEML